ncbi:YncE family protein [Mycolicibacterium pulveris]
MIDTATNKVITTIEVGTGPDQIAVSPDGTKVYVTNFNANTVSVITLN